MSFCSSSTVISIIHTPTVQLVNICGDFDLLTEIRNKVYGLNVKKDFIYNVIKRRHMSVFEFIDTIWYIEASRVTTHELVRHRIASYWQESLRFVKATPKFIVPRSLVKKMGYDKIFNFLSNVYKIYDDLVYGTKKFGEDFKQFARYLLPQCIVNRIFAKFNLRELIEVVLPLRMCRRALPEFRYIAIKMYLQLKERFGDFMNFTGARCVWYGKCPEFGIDNSEIMKKCRIDAYKEAIYEHGTDREIEQIDEIINQLP